MVEDQGMYYNQQPRLILGVWWCIGRATTPREKGMPKPKGEGYPTLVDIVEGS